MHPTFKQVPPKEPLDSIQAVLMPNCASIDHSLKEVFYQAFFTSPLANKLALIE